MRESLLIVLGGRPADITTEKYRSVGGSAEGHTAPVAHSNNEQSTIDHTPPPPYQLHGPWLERKYQEAMDKVLVRIAAGRSVKDAIQDLRQSGHIIREVTPRLYDRFSVPVRERFYFPMAVRNVELLCEHGMAAPAAIEALWRRGYNTYDVFPELYEYFNVPFRDLMRGHTIEKTKKTFV